MPQMLLERISVADEEGTVRRFDYYLTVERMTGGLCPWESYGIRVEEQGGGCAFIRGVTCSRARIRELAELVIHHRVTPLSLADVVADWL